MCVYVPMYMYICMCVSALVKSVCTYVCMYVGICMYVCTYVNVLMYVRACASCLAKARSEDQA